MLVALVCFTFLAPGSLSSPCLYMCILRYKINLPFMPITIPTPWKVWHMKCQSCSMHESNTGIYLEILSHKHTHTHIYIYISHLYVNVNIYIYIIQDMCVVSKPYTTRMSCVHRRFQHQVFAPFGAVQSITVSKDEHLGRGTREVAEGKGTFGGFHSHGG